MITSSESNTIKQESFYAEKQGKLTLKQLQLVYENRWFHLLVPEKLGGREMSLPDFARFVEELATVDGSFAWIVNLGAGANMFAGYLDQITAQKLFASEKTCVAGSGAVGGTALKENNGYRIKGHWKYASGAPHATFFSLNAEIVGENKVKSFLVPVEKVKKAANSWNVFGLKATGSFEFMVDNAWIPESYCFDLQQPSPWTKSSLYSFPFNTLAEINMLVMLAGLAIQFRKLSIEIAKQKEVFGKKLGQKLNESTVFQTRLYQVSGDFDTERKKTFELLEELWKKNQQGESIQEVEKEHFTKQTIQTANAARNLVDNLFPFMGMNVVFEESAISRVFRDFKVASQHALLSSLRS